MYSSDWRRWLAVAYGTYGSSFYSFWIPTVGKLKVNEFYDNT